MKRFYLLALAAALVFAGCKKDDPSSMEGNHFTSRFDPDFAQELQEQGIITDAVNITREDMETIAAITELDVSGVEDNPGPLTSLRGTEYFKSLTTLYCHSNELTTLDVSGCTALARLCCQYNSLTSLDISKNTKLTELYCCTNPGDGESKFPVTVWGDNATKPESLTIYLYMSWMYNGKTITIDFQKAEPL